MATETKAQLTAANQEQDALQDPKGPRTQMIGSPFKGVIGGYVGIYGDYTRVQGPKY